MIADLTDASANQQLHLCRRRTWRKSAHSVPFSTETSAKSSAASAMKSKRHFWAILAVIFFVGLGLWLGPYLYYHCLLGDCIAPDQYIMEFTKTGSSLVVLVVGAGVIRWAFDLRDRERQRIEDEQAFLRAVLADLKTAYDAVDTSRTLIVANFEGYREGQIPALIQASITLRNVRRALKDRGTKIQPALKQELTHCSDFVENIIHEYRRYFDENRYQGIERDRFWDGRWGMQRQGGDGTAKSDPILAFLDEAIYKLEFCDHIDSASRLFRERYMETMQ